MSSSRPRLPPHVAAVPVGQLHDPLPPPPPPRQQSAEHTPRLLPGSRNEPAVDEREDIELQPLAPAPGYGNRPGNETRINVDYSERLLVQPRTNDLAVKRNVRYHAYT